MQASSQQGTTKDERNLMRSNATLAALDDAARPSSAILTVDQRTSIIETSLGNIRDKSSSLNTESITRALNLPNEVSLAQRTRPDPLKETFGFTFTNWRADLTNREILVQLMNLLERELGQPTSNLTDSFATAASQPPITKKSLSELDIGAIIVNPKLRHDVNFDRELHFRPNLDGERGKEKLREAERYWTALEAELKLYPILLQKKHLLASIASRQWLRILKGAQRRIPAMFDMLRDILMHLVPERDQQPVEERLDREKLMQEIENGVCDLPGLSQWLAVLLKAHCAPMRDEWVDRMVKKTHDGVETDNAKSIVEGLKELMGILEAMKLDVANHQIRHLRVLLIEDTVKFEQKYQLTRIANPDPRKCKAEACKTWFEDARNTASRLHSSPHGGNAEQFQRSHPDFVVFLNTILQNLLSNVSLPQSFYLDFDRLQTCRAELCDLVALEICGQVFKATVKDVATSFTESVTMTQSVRDTLMAVVPTTSSGSKRQWQQNVPNLAVEIVRQAFQYCRQAQGVDLKLIGEAEKRLQERFADQKLYANKVEQIVAHDLLLLAGKHISSSPIDLFNAFVSQACPPPPPPPPPSPKPVGMAATPTCASVNAPNRPGTTMLDSSAPHVHVTRKIAHIALLHWQVWAPIVYLRQPTNMSTTETELSSANTAQVNANTASVTQSSESGLDSGAAVTGRHAATENTELVDEQQQAPPVAFHGN